MDKKGGHRPEGFLFFNLCHLFGQFYGQKTAGGLVGEGTQQLKIFQGKRIIAYPLTNRH
jgi:hypothetical protein